MLASTLTLLVLLGLFTWAFTWQLSRALGGNALSWAYVVEWPLFGLYGIYFWWSDLFVGERRGARARTSRGRQAAATRDEAATDQLAAYNAYLADLHRTDGDPST